MVSRPGLVAILAVMLCSCQESTNTTPTVTGPCDGDVLMLNADRHLNSTDHPEAHRRNYRRAYFDYPEGGVWIENDFGRRGPYEESLSTVTQACQEYLRRHDPELSFRLVAYAHHARLWAMNFEAVPVEDTIVVGGALTLWYDAKEGRVIAETRQP